MKYCTHCGNELVDDAVICPKCGCPTDNYGEATQSLSPQNGQRPAQKGPYSPLAIVGFVFAFLIPLVGLICSIVAYKNACVDDNQKAKTFTKAGIIVSAILLALDIAVQIVKIVLTATGVIDGSVWIF